MPPICYGNLTWIPILIFFLMPATFILSYSMAVHYGHVVPSFPYISDTGTTPPESCVFGQLLNIIAAIVCVCVYIRYRHVGEYINYVTASRLRWINRGSLVLGFLAGFGLSIVANFQESQVLTMHMIGAFTAFGVGCIYMLVSTYMCFKMRPHMNPNWICYLRLICAIWSIAFFITTYTTSRLAGAKFHGESRLKWKPEDGGFTEHIISTSSEWSMALGILVYFLSFSRDFHRLSYRPATIIVRSFEMEIQPLLIDDGPRTAHMA
jgi:hypothetical protein